MKVAGVGISIPFELDKKKGTTRKMFDSLFPLDLKPHILNYTKNNISFVDREPATYNILDLIQYLANSLLVVLRSR